jgi:hypothetical protein
MPHDTQWPRPEAERRIGELLDAAKRAGVQKVVDQDGTFEVLFVPAKRSLEELFSAPGPISDDD